MQRKVLFPLLGLVGGVAALVLVLEIVLRFLPVSEGLRTRAVNGQNPVLRFEADRDSTWSRFPGFSMVNEVRTNNYGFVSPVDYDPADPRPLIAVIGDSYMEALMVPAGITGPRLLERELKGEARVYTFASSGSALSQYLAYAEYARETFGPERVIFVIVGNDFDESLLKYKSDAAFHYFEEDDDGALRMVRRDLEISPAVAIARRSRLALYLLNNVGVRSILAGMTASFRREKAVDSYVGNTVADAGRERVEDSERAVDFFLEQATLKTGLEASKVLLVLDGIRPQLYGGAAALEEVGGSYFSLMRSYLKSQARAKGYAVLDLERPFVDEYHRRGVRFEFERDGHWNGEGHRIWCRTVLESGFLEEYRQGGKSSRPAPYSTVTSASSSMTSYR